MKLWNKVLGWCQAQAHLQEPAIRQSLHAIRDEVAAPCLSSSTPRTRRYIILVGFSQCGKSHLVLSHPVLSRYARIESQDLHVRLNGRLAFLRDDTSVSGPAYLERQYLTRWLRQGIERQLLATGVSIVSDSCNLARKDRLAQIRTARAAGYRVTIINVFGDPVEHAHRLVVADDRRVEEGQPRTWWRLVRNNQWSRFQMPELTEVNTIRHYRSGTRIDTLVLEN